jgi:aspartate racemase
LIDSVIIARQRARLLAIVERMKEREGIEGLILGGTELPLLLRDDTYRGIRFLDTTRIHVQAAVAQMLS